MRLLPAGVRPAKPRPAQKVHVAARSRFFAESAAQDWLQILAAGSVVQANPISVQRKPPIPPAQHRQEHGVERQAFSRQSILTSRRVVLIELFSQEIEFNEPGEAIGKDVGRDTDALRKLIESTRSQEAVAHDERTPTVAVDHLGSSDRTWLGAFEQTEVRRTLPLRRGMLERFLVRAVEVDGLRDHRQGADTAAKFALESPPA